MNSRYRRGYEIENRAVKALEAAGYLAVRTAGSHSPFDVIAVSPTGVRLIQVKRIRKGNPVSVLERAAEELRLVPEGCGASREVWVWADGKGWVIQKGV